MPRRRGRGDVICEESLGIAPEAGQRGCHLRGIPRNCPGGRAEGMSFARNPSELPRRQGRGDAICEESLGIAPEAGQRGCHLRGIPRDCPSGRAEGMPFGLEGRKFDLSWSFTLFIRK